MYDSALNAEEPILVLHHKEFTRIPFSEQSVELY